jgi:hypothetical protein
MLMKFQINHWRDSKSNFPLDSAQIEHEYSTFGQMLALYFKAPGIQASSVQYEPPERGVEMIVEGPVKEQALIESVNRFLSTLNAMTIPGRPYQPHFVATIILD